MDVPQQKIRLTQYSKGAGCGCKIAPKDLQEILEGSYAKTEFPNLLVGNNAHDDAAVYDLGNDECLISTTDFFTPVVDDAFDFGKIASANAISDVYAMGGKPVMAIGILGWPIGKIPNAIAKEVIRGAAEICSEAGIPLAGGHSIDAPEPFFGLSVNGLVKKQNLRRNNTAEAGDLIYITKPIGSGILTTGLKRGLLNPNDYNVLINHLTRLNTAGAFFGSLPEVTAMTDITGFGLGGHLLEMSRGAQLTAVITNEKIPLFAGAETLAKQFVYPDNTMRNYQAFLPGTKGLDAGNMFTICDPQTNGGLMVSVKNTMAPSFEKLCSDQEIPVYAIGHFEKPSDKPVVIV